MGKFYGFLYEDDMKTERDMDFEICHTAMIPHDYLLPNVLQLLSTIAHQRGYVDTDADIDEFICGANVFASEIEEHYEDIREELTYEEYDQWHALSTHFSDKDIHYIHITKI